MLQVSYIKNNFSSVVSNLNKRNIDFSKQLQEITELDDLRNEFEIWDDEGDSFEFSDAGKEFITTNESINDDGWLEAYSDGASEDFIYDLQNEWQLSLYKD